MTIKIGIAIENGVIGERLDNDPDFDFDLESPDRPSCTALRI